MTIFEQESYKRLLELAAEHKINVYSKGDFLVPRPNSIKGIIATVLRAKELPYDKFKAYAKTMVRLRKKCPDQRSLKFAKTQPEKIVRFRIQHKVALELLACAMGYRDFNDLARAREEKQVDGETIVMVKNLNFKDPV